MSAMAGVGLIIGVSLLVSGLTRNPPGGDSRIPEGERGVEIPGKVVENPVVLEAPALEASSDTDRQTTRNDE